jgi:predicted transcriptional regulator
MTHALGQPVEIVFYRSLHNTPETCDELEVRWGITHQTASAAINKLMREGRIKNSGVKRRTRQGRSATVWVSVGPKPSDGQVDLFASKETQAS